MKIIGFIKKQEIRILGTLFIGGLVWIFGSFFMNLSFPDSSYNFLGTSNKAKLDPGKPITQVFQAKENNLNQIKIILGDSSIQPREEIVFELADSMCDKTLAQKTYHFYNISPFIYYHFTFPTIFDSAGQTYCIRVTYYSPVDRNGDRPYLDASKGSQFMGWSYTNSGNGLKYENRTLQMRPAYGTGSLLSDLGRLNDRISQYKPEFLKGSALTLIFGVFLIGTLTLIFQIIRSKNE